MGRMTAREAWSFFAGFIVDVVAILALVSLLLAMERNKWKSVAEEQADTIRRYEDITAEYEELTVELFKMLEGGKK